MKILFFIEFKLEKKIDWESIFNYKMVSLIEFKLIKMLN